MAEQWTDADIRRDYAWDEVAQRPDPRRLAVFDAWLAAHDRQVAERAWDEGYAAGGSRARRQWSDEPNAPEATNPYRADSLVNERSRR